MIHINFTAKYKIIRSTYNMHTMGAMIEFSLGYQIDKKHADSTEAMFVYLDASKTDLQTLQSDQSPINLVQYH